MSEACARIVERDDPHLYATALFAPEPARSRLMVLYAFDCELSRASRDSTESLIPMMRLQWWSDTLDAALEGHPPKSHEVAGPLASLVTADTAPWLEAMVQARRMERALPFDPGTFQEWAACRFTSRLKVAAHVATGAGLRSADMERLDCAGNAFGAGCALRLAARMGRGGGTFIGELRGVDIARVGAGTLCPERAAVLAKAQFGLKHLQSARRGRQALDKAVRPVLLALLWEERALDLVRADPRAVAGQLDNIDRPFDGLRLVWRSLSGRW